MRNANTYILVVTMVAFVSCERNFDIALKNNQTQLIVEGYINNELSSYNYVVLGRSQSYFQPGFENIPVTGATVTITEGTLVGVNTYSWDQASRRQLKEGRFPQFNDQQLPGVYFDPMLIADPAKALKGTPGKQYLLEIEADGKQYSAITALLPLIPIDSVTSGFHFIDEDEDTTQTKARLTVHYKDPDTIGNTVLYYWSSIDSRSNFGWGAMGTNRFTPGTDDLVNGEYIDLTLSNSFVLGDSINYYVANVERKVYNFWDSFNKARSNEGPFATPVRLLNTISGDNVIGCFSGFSLSTKSMVVQ